MTKQVALPFSLLLIFFFLCTTTSGQAPAPAPTGPTNITAVLEKAGQFTTFIRLLKATQMADQINTQLNNSNQGLTMFAPTDNAFASLKSGTLNSLNDQQKVQLLQFHVLPNLYSTSQFQTVSNPLRTQAGNSGNGEFPLNITTSGNNEVNISTGVNTATVANTIYTDSQLAVYQVDQVLLPLDLFGVQAPAPAPVTPEKDLPSKAPSKSSDTTNNVDSSAAMPLNYNVVAVLSFSFALLSATYLQL